MQERKSKAVTALKRPLTKNSQRKRIQDNLPVIPDKRYFTIGEASKLCAVQPHVLRYWEQEFNQLNPIKRRGNRRFYQKHEIVLIRQIRKLLYENGFTIEGARAKLTRSSEYETVKEIIADLESVLEKLKTEEAT